jgi:hypothetical protein
MNIKTFLLVFWVLSILFSGCAAEIEYWTKRMQESKKASPKETGETQAEETKQVTSTPPAPARPPVAWPPSEQPSTSQELSPVTPSISTTEVTTKQMPTEVATKATFTINMKDGEKYIGEILLGEISFKTAYGLVKVKLDNLTSFSQGTIKMQDGSSIKGAIDHSTIKIKTTGLGELEIKTSDIESIAR